MFPEPTVVEPSKEHLHTIIFLHGRGSTAPEFANELFESQSQSGATLQELLPHYKWVFPSAQSLYSNTFREDMSQWYDYSTLGNLTGKPGVEVERLRESIVNVEGIVERERAFVPSGKVVLGGISQGFSVAVMAALVNPVPYEALVGYASWLPYGDFFTLELDGQDEHKSQAELRSETSSTVMEMLGGNYTTVCESLATAIFLAHNSDDEVVEVARGRKMAGTLQRLGHIVSYFEFNEGGHWINEPDGIDRLAEFLKENGL